MNPRFLFVLTAMLLMLGACGQKGDLYLPETDQPSPREPANKQT